MPTNPGTNAPGGKGAEATGRRGDELARPFDPRGLELLARTRVERLETEARLERDHRDVDLVAIEEGNPVLRVVGSGVERESTFRGHELAVTQERRLAPFAERLTKRRRPEMLMKVDRRHAAQSSFPRPPERTSAMSGSRSGSASPSATNGTRPRTARSAAEVPLP